MEKKKTVLIFSFDRLIHPRIKEAIRQNLLKQINEGVVVLDSSLDYVKTVLPEDTEIQIELVDMEDEDDKTN